MAPTVPSSDRSSPPSSSPPDSSSVSGSSSPSDSSTISGGRSPSESGSSESDSCSGSDTSSSPDSEMEEGEIPNYDNGVLSEAEITSETPASIDVPWDMFPQIEANLRTLYEADIPLFSKDVLRQIASSFDDIIAGSNDKVSVPGFDGVPVDFRIRVGERPNHNLFKPAHDTIVGEPRLAYRSFEMMTCARGFIDWVFMNPPITYLSMVVCHENFRVEWNSNTIVPDPDGCAPSTHQEVEPLFRSFCKQWQTTESFGRIQSLFAGSVPSVTVPSNIDKVVALSCSTMAVGNDLIPRSAAQHALALGIRDILVSQGKESVSCYAQDPAYQDADKSVLGQEGVVVLKDPRAFLEIDEASVVIAAASHIPVRQIVADLARPAVMIWDRVTAEVNYDHIDTVSPRVREMIETSYIEVEFPRDENFGNVAIYVRKT